MREPATLSRRSAAALPLAALFGPAASAMPASASVGADVELLDLGRRWQAALAAELAQGRTWRETMSRAESLAHGAAGDVLHAEVETLFNRITATPATTVAGLAVKARILAYENDIEQFDEASIAEALSGAHYFEDRAAFSLALDCLRLARAAS